MTKLTTLRIIPSLNACQREFLFQSVLCLLGSILEPSCSTPRKPLRIFLARLPYIFHIAQEMSAVNISL